MDYIDKMIKKRVESEEWTIPKSLDNTINCVLNDLPKRKVYKRTPLKILVPIALIIVLTTTTVFATGLLPVKNTMNKVISFFQGESDTKYISDKQNFEKFNNAVGLSFEDKGIKLTVDNIAVDDNFLNIFYTIESNKPIPKKDKNEYFSALFTFPIFDYKINGKTLKVINNNDVDAYFESEYKLKGMKRLNISGATLKDNFPLEISTNEIFETKGKWTICTTIDKTLTKADTKTVTPNQTANIKFNDVSHKITIDKVSISPFGSQMLISEWVLPGKHIFNLFALFDEDGNSLDVLNTDQIENHIIKTTNAFEFVKTNKDMKYITLVPIKIESDIAPKPLPNPVGDIDKFPIVLKVSETGNIVVDNIYFTQNQIKIIYHKEGLTLFDPSFQFCDKDGKEIDLDNYIVETSVDRVNGKYTQTLTASKSDLSKGSFEISKVSKIAKISTYANTKFDLLYDQQVRIELNK